MRVSGNPKETGSQPRVLARTESSRTQSGTKQGGPPHDHWAKLGQLRHTRSQYSFVVIALFSMEFIAPPSRRKDVEMPRIPETSASSRSRVSEQQQFAFCGWQRMNCVDGSSLAHRDAFAFWSCGGAT